MDHAEVVFDVIFPAGDESAEVVHPCKEPFHLPASAIAARRAPVLSFLLSPSPVGSDHFDTAFGGEFFVERVRVVGFVADEPCGELVKEVGSQNVFHKLEFGWRSAVDRYCERKTVASGDSDDLGALAAAGGTDGKAPFWRSRRWRPRRLLPGLICLARADAP